MERIREYVGWNVVYRNVEPDDQPTGERPSFLIEIYTNAAYSLAERYFLDYYRKA